MATASACPDLLPEQVLEEEVFAMVGLLGRTKALGSGSESDIGAHRRRPPLVTGGLREGYLTHRMPADPILWVEKPR